MRQVGWRQHIAMVVLELIPGTAGVCEGATTRQIRPRADRYRRMSYPQGRAYQVNSTAS